MPMRGPDLVALLLPGCVSHFHPLLSLVLHPLLSLVNVLKASACWEWSVYMEHVKIH